MVIQINNFSITAFPISSSVTIINLFYLKFPLFLSPKSLLQQLLHYYFTDLRNFLITNFIYLKLIFSSTLKHQFISFTIYTIKLNKYLVKLISINNK